MLLFDEEEEEEGWTFAEVREEAVEVELEFEEGESKEVLLTLVTL
jgi:hypothetical protein